MSSTWGDPVGRHYVPKGEPVAAPLQVRLWAAVTRAIASQPKRRWV